ncbi:hypothetical protein JL722_13819 [Aureococcus anophagefferens]|nr:hypothetical protein JL722_13819 [Aureococcus anophagefferens]
MSPQSPPDLESEFASLLTDGTLAIPVAAIQVLLGVIERSSSATMHGLDEELRLARDKLLAFCETQPACLRGRTVISVSSGSELFLRHVTRTFLEFEDFDECKRMPGGSSFAPVRGEPRAHRRARPRLRARRRRRPRPRPEPRRDRALAKAAETKHFSVFVTEGRPDGAGVDYASDLAALGVPTTMILDTAVAYYMENVDVVLVGAEGVMENGGVINKAHGRDLRQAARKPVYVAAESYKFARLYPLNQRDLPVARATRCPPSPRATSSYKSPACDYTPPQFITLLFTDLGILTPAAVSDELIRLYQWVRRCGRSSAFRRPAGPRRPADDVYDEHLSVAVTAVDRNARCPARPA